MDLQTDPKYGFSGMVMFNLPCSVFKSLGSNVFFSPFSAIVPDFQKPTVGIFVMLTLVITCSVCIYKVFKVDIVLWYRDSFYDFLPKKGTILYSMQYFPEKVGVVKRVFIQILK